MADKKALPKDVEEILERAKRSREELTKQLDENAFAESIREAIKE
jgi:hypothetical protein